MGGEGGVGGGGRRWKKAGGGKKEVEGVENVDTLIPITIVIKVVEGELRRIFW